MNAIAALIRRDVVLAGRVGGSGGLALCFFLMVVAIVPFGLGPDLVLLSRIGPAILWIAGVLATLIGLDRLFGGDAEDGSLDLMRLSPVPLELLCLAKTVAHWLVTGLPLALATPLFGLLLGLDPEASLPVAASLLLGTPALTALGAVAAAIAAGVRRGGLVIAILAVPLMIPTLIFGVAASGPDAAARGSALLVLACLSLASVAIATIGAAAALRHA